MFKFRWINFFWLTVPASTVHTVFSHDCLLASLIIILLGRMRICAFDPVHLEKVNCFNEAGKIKPVDLLTCSKVVKRPIFITLFLFRLGVLQFILVYYLTAVVQTTQKLLAGQDVGNVLPPWFWKSWRYLKSCSSWLLSSCPGQRDTCLTPFHLSL